jgi:hypothetical protein
VEHSDGPRYDPAFPPDQLNSDGNLLLLCGVHHHPVDRNGSNYTTGELLQWKKAQTADGAGFTVQDDDINDLAARLESSLDELVQATRLQMQARLVANRLGWPTIPQWSAAPWTDSRKPSARQDTCSGQGASSGWKSRTGGP